MGLKNCPDCGKLFVDNPSGVCQECYRRQEEDEFKVGDFLRQRDTATVEEIHAATGVPEKTILKMVRSGRLYSKGVITYPCESCGAPITEGRLCFGCSNNILSQVKQSDKAPEKKTEETARKGERMYTMKN